MAVCSDMNTGQGHGRVHVSSLDYAGFRLQNIILVALVRSQCIVAYYVV